MGAPRWMGRGGGGMEVLVQAAVKGPRSVPLDERLVRWAAPSPSKQAWRGRRFSAASNEPDAKRRWHSSKHLRITCWAAHASGARGMTNPDSSGGSEAKRAPARSGVIREELMKRARSYLKAELDHTEDVK